MNPAKSYEHIFSPQSDSSDQLKSFGILTFMRAPHVALDRKAIREKKARFAFLGVPYDEGNIGKPGSTDGPHGMREGSTQYFPYMFEYGVDIFSCCPIVDCGDVLLTASHPEVSHKKIYDAVSEVLESGAVPILCGGDHSVSIPAARALSDFIGPEKKMGYLHVGAHLDMADSWGGERITSVSAMARATELSNVDPKNVAHIGARNSLNPKDFVDLARERGIKYFPMWDIVERGILPVTEDAADLVWNGTHGQYVTFDLNAMDASCAPGVTAPEPGGIETREIIQAASALGRRGSVGIVEVAELSPIYDINMITCKLAACIVYHFIASLAQSEGCRVDPSLRRKAAS